MIKSTDLSQYGWQGFPSFGKGTSKYDRCQNIVEATSPDSLAAYVSKLEGGKQCHVEDLVTHGGCHFLRMVTLDDGQRWVARFRIPPIPQPGTKMENAMVSVDTLMQREVDCLYLMSQRTTVPVPRVIACGTSGADFGTPFIVMECLPGSCAMDINFNFIPEEYKTKFFKQMANAHVQTSSLLFPMIGALALADDGNVTVGPIPGIGGPFKTATSFFRAWAAAAKFPHTEDKVKQACGPLGDEVWQTTSAFPEELSQLADRICARNDCGPFPLVHVDFGHNNIVVDPEYNILGVIDWEHAYAAPWETIDYPTTVWVTPPPMDLPTNYSDDGVPKDEKTRAKYQDRDRYLQAVKEAEQELSASSKLSDILGDRNLQNVATAMQRFLGGKMGFYTRVLDAYRSSA